MRHHHYILLRIFPTEDRVVIEELALRQAITLVLTQLFGTTRALVQIDILSISKQEAEHPRDAAVEALIRMDKRWAVCPELLAAEHANKYNHLPPETWRK